MKDSKLNQPPLQHKPSHIEKVYKEDSEDTLSYMFKPKLAPQKRLTTNQMDPEDINHIQNQIKLLKHKSVDDRKRIKMMKKIKSMKLDHDLLMNDPCLLTNFPPAAGRKLDTIYNKTLSMLCHTPCNYCASPLDAQMHQENHDKYNIAVVPMKLHLENNKTKYEVCFDYDIKKDTEKAVAAELRKALELPQKYDKRIIRSIKALLREKIVMIEILLLLNEKSKNQKHEQHYDPKQKDVQEYDHPEEACEEKNCDLAVSMDTSLNEKLHIIKRRKRDRSFNMKNKKLLKCSNTNARRIAKDDINSRRSKLNVSASEKYQATDINLNMFNLYEYHNSFTASSYFKHSFHSVIDKIGRSHFSG